jgi:hypothetical protein
MTRATGTGKRARKRTTTVTEEIPEGEALAGEEPVSEFDLSLEQVQDLEAMNAVLEDYGIEEAVRNFKIYKVTDGVQRYVFEHPTLDESYIQRERGGGNYVARFFFHGKYKKSIPVFIEDLPESANKPNGNGNSNSHSAFLEKMLMALIVKETNHSNGTPSITELTQALANMDSLRGKQESTVDLLIKGIEMGRSFDGGGGSLDWKTELMRLAKDNLPGLVGVIQQGIAMKNGQQVPAQVPVVPGNPNPPVMDEGQEMALMLKHAIGVLKSQFMMGLDGESAVALIMTNIANPQYQRIIQQFVMMSFDELVALDADIGKEPFNSRFRFVHDGLRSALSEADQVESDTGGGSGNVVDLGRDGKSSKVR